MYFSLTHLTRSISILLSVLLCLMLGACAARVGASHKQTMAGVDQVNGSPNTLSMTDAEGQWSANTTGPSRYTSVGEQGIETFQTGTVPRDVYWDRATGRLVISSGSDIQARDVLIDPDSGRISIGEFATVGSEVIRAGNEAFDRLKEYWGTRDQASRDVIIRQIEMAENITPDVRDVLLGLLTGL